MDNRHLLIGQTLTFIEDPFFCHPMDATHHETHGGLVIENGLITDIGPADDLALRYPDAQKHDYGNSIITAGFIDPHVHYPQTAIISSWGARLVEWLEKYTFPEEARFNNATYAEMISKAYIQTVLSHGTTSFASFCTTHPCSVDAIFTEAAQIGMRIAAGLTCMDRNAPATLLDSAQESYDNSKTLIQQWHNNGRMIYAISPRFAPTSSPSQLDCLGSLWNEYPECLMQTHLSEQTEEVSWSQELYPDCQDYLAVYEKYGLIGDRGLYGHAIHLSQREHDRLLERGCSLIHCPTSNLFIGSGLFNAYQLKSDGLSIGLATDTGGGSSFSMLRTMAVAYEISQLHKSPLHPAQLYWLATVGNARTMKIADKIGNLQIGYEADLIVINPFSTRDIEQTTHKSEDIWDLLFPTIMMGDDRAIDAVWINGKSVLCHSV